ncbi:MAG: glycosyltransferase [Longimicrobiales bacterium]
MKALLISSMYHRLDQPLSATYMHRQVLALRSRGVEVQVLCPIPHLLRGPRTLATGEPLPDQFELDDVTVHTLPYRSPPLRWLPRRGVSVLAQALVNVTQRIRQDFRFQLIHSKRLYPTTAGAIAAAQTAGVPLVGGAAGSDVHTHPLRGTPWADVTREAISGSDQVISVSKGLARQIVEIGKPKREVVVVYNGVDADAFSPPADQVATRRELGLPEQGIGLCFVGRTVLAKGLHELLDAFGRVVANYPSAWLAVVGDGPDRLEVEQRAEELGLAERVFFPGAKSNADVPAWLQAADVFVLPSHNEGLPNVVLEAMAVGLPVIATDVGGTAEAVDEGATGFLTMPKDTDALTEVALRLVGDSSLRQSMGSAGRQRVLEHFTWDRSAASLETVYRSVTEAYRKS